QGRGMNTIDLGGRVAVVTGGASGIGAAIAQRYAASGARVAVWDMNGEAAKACAAALPAAAGGGHAGFAVDVSDEQGVERATADTIAAFGRADILCCSAGITGPNTTTWEYPVADWKQVMEVNVNGVFLCNR